MTGDDQAITFADNFCRFLQDKFDDPGVFSCFGRQCQSVRAWGNAVQRNCSAFRLGDDLLCEDDNVASLYAFAKCVDGFEKNGCQVIPGNNLGHAIWREQSHSAGGGGHGWITQARGNVCNSIQPGPFRTTCGSGKYKRLESWLEYS